MRRVMLLMGVVVVGAAAWLAGCGGGGTSGGKTEEAARSLPAGGIVFTRSLKSGGRPSLYLMKPDGSQVRLLMRNAADAAVSPDGSRIAFCRDRAIWIVRRDGSAARQLTRPPSKDTSDCDQEWSADGRSLFFSRFAPKTYLSNIYSISAEGGPVRRVSKPPLGSSGSCPMEPSPSPDGRLIAYADTGFECGRGVYYVAVMTTTGREASIPFRTLYTMTEDGQWYEQSGPAWSPDGRRLAFVVSGLGDDTKDGIWVASAGGSPPRRVARGSSSSPSWSPDGKWIVFGCGDISLIRADGTGRHKLATTPATECAPVWLPPAH